MFQLVDAFVLLILHVPDFHSFFCSELTVTPDFSHPLPYKTNGPADLSTTTKRLDNKLNSNLGAISTSFIDKGNLAKYPACP
jgi:hypothetical protein